MDSILQQAFEQWRGTPFSPNAGVPGPAGGVSCQKLVGAIYRLRGIESDVPEVPMNHWRFSKRSIAEEYMAQRTDFKRLPTISPFAAVPWDLLGLRLGHVIHHLGICVDPGEFIHVIEGQGVAIASIYDATWWSRLAAIWRPLK